MNEEKLHKSTQIEESKAWVDCIWSKKYNEMKEGFLLLQYRELIKKSY